jgi:hypothetical protein
MRMIGAVEGHTGEETHMETFVILRRQGWNSAAELQDAAAPSMVELERRAGTVQWIRTYVFGENDGTLGTVCVFQAPDEDTIREYADAARLHYSEILRVGDTIVVNPDPAPVPAP